MLKYEKNNITLWGMVSGLRCLRNHIHRNIDIFLFDMLWEKLIEAKYLEYKTALELSKNKKKI